MKSKIFVVLSFGLFLGGSLVGSVSQEEVASANAANAAEEGAKEGAKEGAQDGSKKSERASSENEGKPVARPQKSASRTSSGEVCLTDPMAIEDIRAQRDEIAEARKKLAEREAELKVREQALVEEIKKIESARDEIAKINGVRKKDQEERVAKLIETIEAMSPKAAAKMMADLDETLAVSAISRLDTSKLAKIMNLIEPAKAARLTELLTGVNRSRGLVAKASTQSTKGGERDDGQHNNQSTKHDASSGAESSAGRQPASASPVQKGGKTGN